MEFWGNGIPEIILFTSIVCLVAKKMLFTNNFFQTLAAKLSLKCNLCQRNRTAEGDRFQENGSVHRQIYPINARYENGKTNGMKRNSQIYFDSLLHTSDGDIPISFGGSFGVKFAFGSGHKHTHPLNLEMKKFSTEIKKSLTSNPPTFDEWYHRKSGVVILSVCQWKTTSRNSTEEDSDQFVYTRGINVEVSLATGSICAERVAISQAHTSYPELKGRHNLSAVAVLHLSTDMNENKDIVGDNPKLPCGMCQIWIEKLACQNNFRVIAYPDRDLNQYIEFYRPRLVS